MSTKMAFRPSTKSYMDLCRLCANQESIKMDIFSLEGREKKLIEKIETCLSFQVDETDKLPRHICYRCILQLENFHDFQKGCFSAFEWLESCIQKEELENQQAISFNIPSSIEEKEIPSSPFTESSLSRGPSSLEEDNFLKDHDKDENISHESPQIRAVTERLKLKPKKSDPASSKHACSTCNRIFISRGALTLHSRNCNQPGENNLFPCTICERIFSSKGHLTLHCKIHEGTGDSPSIKRITSLDGYRQFKCNLCDKSYSTSKHLWGHVSVCHRGDPIVTCCYCSRIFSTKSNLDEHKRSKHAVELLTGQENNLEIQNGEYNSALINEENLLNEDILFTCNICYSAFKSKSELNLHSMIHTDNNQSLLKQTLLRCEVKRHLIDPENENPLKRPLIESNFTSGNRRKNFQPRKIARLEGDNHVHSSDDSEWSISPVLEEVEKVDNPTSFSCLLCDQIFLSRSDLSDHFENSHGLDYTEIMHSSSANKEIVGSDEGHTIKSTNDEDNAMSPDITDDLMEFNEDDLENKNFNNSRDHTVSCQVCIREFNDRASLWLHMRYTHKEQASLACGICLKICEDNNELKAHWKSRHDKQTEMRRYSCTMCGRQHDSRKKLVTHVSIHNLEDGCGGNYDPEKLVIQNSGYHLISRPEDESPMPTFESRYSSASMEVGSMQLYRCEICFKAFTSESSLLKHKRGMHARPNPNSLINNKVISNQLFFVCEICGSSHGSKTDRWRHVATEHSQEISIRCELPACQKVFPTRALCHEHCQMHHQEQGATPNTCEICGKLWGTRVDYWKHLMGVHPDIVSLTCGVCLKMFCNVDDLQNHVKSQHMPFTTGDYNCDVCGRPYSNRAKMLRHRLIHNVPQLELETPVSKNRSRSNNSLLKEPLQCESCPTIKFEDLTELAEHRKRVHFLVPCDLCPKFYGRNSHLWKHVNRVHKNHPALTCQICHKISATQLHLKNHMQSKHSTEDGSKQDINTAKEYLCPYCQKSFYRRILLKKHIKRCTYAKRSKLKVNESFEEFKCEACNKIFISLARLKEHQRYHPTYLCELCPELKFNTSLNLIDHIREKHPNHPDFFCDIIGCPIVVRSRIDLEMHKQMHIQNKYPPTCTICGEICNNKPRLLRHLNSYHKLDIPYFCGVCFIRMNSTEELIEHTKTHHPLELKQPNTCQICAKVYSSVYKVVDHCNKYHLNYYVCKECLVVFTNKEELDQHLLIPHENKKNNKEEILEEEEEDEEGDEDDIDSPPKLKNQEAETLREDNENMPILEKITDIQPQESRPKRHYTCTICQLTFRSPSELFEHKNTKHKPPPGPYHCELCDKFFSNNSSYTKHIHSPLHLNKLIELKEEEERIQKEKEDLVKKLVEEKRDENIRNSNVPYSNDRDEETSVEVDDEEEQVDIGKNEEILDDETSESNEEDGNEEVLEEEEDDVEEEDEEVEGESEEDSEEEVEEEEDDDDDDAEEEEEDIQGKEDEDNTQLKEDEEEDVEDEQVSLEYDEDEENEEEQIMRDIELDGEMPIAQEVMVEEIVEPSVIDFPYKSNTITLSGGGYFCRLCRKMFPGVKHLWQHVIRNHPRAAAVTCGVCMEICDDYNDLSIHLKNLHPTLEEDAGNFTCRICGRYHNARSKLIAHATIHTILGPEESQQPQAATHSCTLCNRVFNSARGLEDHVRIHIV